MRDPTSRLDHAWALSVHQPWAWALATGVKPVENRVWWSNWRGPVLIQASKWWSPAEIGDALEWMKPLLEMEEMEPPSLDELFAQTGKIIAVQTVAGRDQSRPNGVRRSTT